MFTLGEDRHTSAGNVFRLEEYDGRNSVRVRRVAIIGKDIDSTDIWDNDVLWNYWQWDSLPLLGECSSDPSFGLFGRT
jgi:hypothetical protein